MTCHCHSNDTDIQMSLAAYMKLFNWILANKAVENNCTVDKREIKTQIQTVLFGY